MKIVFMGTPDFAVPALEKLITAGHDIVAVYTQPPRPKGRGQHVQPSPVHVAADRHNIPVYTPKSLRRDESAQAQFVAHNADIAVVAAYGLLLPRAVLEAPKHGCLNIHASLLPRWRGASPIQHAVWKGDAQSGISIMQMDEGLDTGAVVSMCSVAIQPYTTAQSLHDDLSALGGRMIDEALRKLAADGKITATAQEETGVTHAPLLKKEDGKIDWSHTAAQIDCQIRGLNPWPGVWTTMPDGRRFKILSAALSGEPVSGSPGTLCDRAGHVACGGSTGLKLLKIQPDSAKPMDFAAALNGGYLNPGGTFS